MYETTYEALITHIIKAPAGSVIGSPLSMRIMFQNSMLRNAMCAETAGVSNGNDYANRGKLRAFVTTLLDYPTSADCINRPRASLSCNLPAGPYKMGVFRFSRV